MEATIYNQTGKKVRTGTLPEVVFDLPWNGDLVHQVTTSMIANARISVAQVKDRSEVSGGGKKPWRQKGTGRARHGSRRSPIWRGGGITFGPSNERNFEKKINKKMKRKALAVLLSEKLRVGEVLFLDELSFGAIKTAEAKKVLEALSSISGFDALATKRNNAVCFYLPTVDEKVARSFSNFGNVALAETTQMNPLDIARYKYIVIVGPEETSAFLSSKFAK